MAAPLAKKKLLGILLRAISDSGWQAIVTSSVHPFLLRVFREDERGFDVRVYIWNCTHGGGAKRATDEYRIQLTGVVPNVVSGVTTLLLGWHNGYGVFVGFDIAMHKGQDAKSPSIQIKEAALADAHLNAFSIYERHNNEIAVAFRPEFWVEYALNSKSLHRTGKAVKDLSLLNSLNTITDAQIESVKTKNRQTIIRQIAIKYRAYDFRRRVLGAYSHRCAICGVQLDLIDAAHIIPVFDATSTDETTNGVALCKLHHAAFDRNLVSFDEHYKIEVNKEEVARLKHHGKSAGLNGFKKQLKTALILPNDRRDYPKVSYIKKANSIRKWLGKGQA
jgi:putative restriction endonuclease